jgi:hypothetical protein
VLHVVEELRQIQIDGNAESRLDIDLHLSERSVSIPSIPVCEYYAVVKNEFDRLLCNVRNRQELPLAGHG